MTDQSVLKTINPFDQERLNSPGQQVDADASPDRRETGKMAVHGWKLNMARKPDPGKKRQIVEAAFRVFAGKGYAAARIIDVAETAGVGKGTIYEYFRSKEDLFFAVFEEMMTDTNSRISVTIAAVSGSAADRLRAVADAVVTAWLPKLDSYALVMEFWSAATVSPLRRRFKESFQEAYNEFRRVIAALLREGMTSGEFAADIDVHKTASALIGTWDSLLLQAWLDPGFDPLGASRAFVEVLFNGLRSKEIKEPS
jgi:AcrR family transcriptional regulator